MKTAILSCSEPARAAPCFQRRQRAKPRVIQGLQSTAAQQLTILKDNLTVSQQGSFTTSRSVLTGDPGTFTPTEVINRSAERTVDVSGTMLFLLEKIAFNTFATSFNVAEQNRIMGSGLPWRVGNYGAGGWINGGIPGRDSVPVMAMPDEFMVSESATRALVRDYGAGIMDTINAGRLPERTNVVPFRAPPVIPRGGSGRNSDNGETVQELKEVKKLLERLLEGLGNDSMIKQRQNNQNTSRVVEAIEEVIGDGAKRITSEMRMSARRNKE